MGESGRSGSLVLIHGAGSGPWVFDGWASAFPSLEVVAVDLQRDVEAGRASMAEYVATVVGVARELRRPVVLCGWSMGGLVALQAAAEVQPRAVVLVEASAPAEVQGFNPEIALTPGSFDPEAEYGHFPPGIPARQESLLARSERKRGISVPTLPCPSLVIYGADFPGERGAELAALYGSTEIAFPDLGHFDLVLDPQVRHAIARYLDNLV